MKNNNTRLMKTIELFSGTKSFSKVMTKYGHETFTIDNDLTLEPDLCVDILNDSIEFPYKPDIIWASPPCTAFSVASIGHHWTGGKQAYVPKTKEAKIAMDLVRKTLRIIKASEPKWWFIENPRGVLRKLGILDGFRRVTVTYCQYGDSRMKPTDIWTNADWWEPRSMCKNGDTCHEAAPRGARTGTQGLRGSKARGVIPPTLFEEILNFLTPTYMRYRTNICSVCGTELTRHDKGRKSRKLFTPFVYDCEDCEFKRIRQLRGDK